MVSDKKDENLNQKIAKIDGYYREIECELWSNVGEHWHDAGLVCYYTEGIPDYLAPENLHELVRVLEKVCYSYDHEWDGTLHTYQLWDESARRIANQTSEKQSEALAEAIVEAKG